VAEMNGIKNKIKLILYSKLLDRQSERIIGNAQTSSHTFP